MDWQTVINLLIGVVVPGVVWMGKRLTDTDKALSDLRVEMARDYVRHTHLDDIRDSLRRILDILDRKADK